MFFAWSATALALGIYTLYWPTTEADVEYYKPQRILITGDTPKVGYTQKISADLKLALYTYKVRGVSYSSSTVCYCSTAGISNNLLVPRQTRISYFPSNPEYSVLFKGPDLLLVIMLALSGASILFGWRFLVGYFVKNA